MGIMSTTTGFCLLFIVISTIIINTEAATRTGRTYGTWVDRRKQRECRRSLICEYRQTDCMNNTPDTQWKCTALSNSMQAKMCVLKRCEPAMGMECLEVPPGENMTEVDSNSCALGQKCYAPIGMTTPAPFSTTFSVITPVPASGTPAPLNGSATVIPSAENSTAFPTGPTFSIFGPDANVSTESVTTPSFGDENATTIIWSSAALTNSTRGGP